MRLVSHELASTRILTNIIYESQRNRRRKKRLKKNDGKRRKKNGRCCCVSLEKEKGLLLLELCVGEEEDVCFFSPHPKFRLEETLFQTLVASFASSPLLLLLKFPLRSCRCSASSSSSWPALDSERPFFSSFVSPYNKKLCNQLSTQVSKIYYVSLEARPPFTRRLP